MIDKELKRFIFLFYILAFISDLANAMIQKSSGIEFEGYSYSRILISTIFYYRTKFIYLYLTIWVVVKLLVTNKLPFFITLIAHFVNIILFTIYFSSIRILYEKFIFNLKIEDFYLEFIRRFTYGFSFNFFVYSSLIAIVYAFYYLKSKKEKELTEINLKTQLLDSKMNALNVQLQPHFLFNTLNDISSLIDIDKSKSQDAITDLSDLLRNTLQLKDIKFHTVENELNLLENYIKIEKLRFDKKLDVQINVDINSLKENIPPLILQPILENAIKHGFSYNHDHLVITISIKTDGNKLKIHITNDGEPLKSENISYGNGLKNVIERLYTIYNDDFLFLIENIKNNTAGVIIKIEIPTSKDLHFEK